MPQPNSRSNIVAMMPWMLTIVPPENIAPARYGSTKIGFAQGKSRSAVPAPTAARFPGNWKLLGT
jgi:hypothetical protein